MLILIIHRRLHDEFIHHFTIIESLHHTIQLVRKITVCDIDTVQIGFADPGDGGMNIVDFVETV